jgi:hypothetical protein
MRPRSQTGIDVGDEVVVEILSDTFGPSGFDGRTDSRTFGVQVKGVTLLGPAEDAAR